jgi:hypothetical protein
MEKREISLKCHIPLIALSACSLAEDIPATEIRQEGKPWISRKRRTS